MLVFLIILALIFFLLLFVLLFFTFLAIDVFLELPYVGTKKEKIETILKLANIKRGGTVIDLGSGDGRLLFACAQQGARAIGYELNPFLVLLSRVKAKIFLNRFQNIQRSLKKMQYCSNISEVGSDSSEVKSKGSILVKRQNFWKADLSVANVIFVYGLKKTMQKFEDFIYKNAQPETRVVVNTNPFPNKQAVKSDKNIFLYII